MRIAVDDTRVYWLSILQNPQRARIRSCQKNDCRSTIMTYDESPPIFPRAPGESPGAEYYSLAVAANHVYWTRPAVAGLTILSCPSGGCDGAPTVVDDKIPLTAMVVDETHLYWTSNQDTAIYRRPLSDMGRTEAIALNQPNIGEVQVDATHAYWFCTEAGGAYMAIRRVNKQGGGRPEILATNVAAWTLDATSLFWGPGPIGSISRCPLSGCSEAPTVLIGDRGWSPGAIVSDGTSIFWITFALDSQDEGRGTVMRCPIDDCGSRKEALASLTFHSDPRYRTSMVADDSHVYWIAQGEPDYRGGPLFYPRATIYRHAK